MDDNPRPLKRARIPSPSDSSSPPPQQPVPAPIPDPVLLLSIPAAVLHPPNHPLHAVSLALSLRAINKCLAYDNLDSDVECRAWTAFAELALKVISGGFHSDPDEHPWAKGIEAEVRIAMSISSRHTKKIEIGAECHQQRREYL